MTDNVDHPSHYGGKDNPYETIKVIDSWGLDFCLGNAVKYISRAGKKDKDKHIEDLRKAIFYIEHEIELLKGQDMTELFKTLQNSSNEELKPCPFCGASGELAKLRLGHQVQCTKCLAIMLRTNDDDAIDNWNERVKG